MTGLALVSRRSVMVGVWVESNFYTMSNGSVVVGPVVVVGDSFSRIIWSRGRCCLCLVFVAGFEDDLSTQQAY